MGKRSFQFGTWNDKPIEWEVLKEDDFKTMVITREAIGKRTFSSKSKNIWKESELRYFLQEDFFKNAFSKEEKRRIINTKLTDVGDSKDNVFILSEGEVSSLLNPTDYYEQKITGCSNCLWTRSPFGNNSYQVIIKRGNCDGSCWKSSGDTRAIRPVMYIKK